MDYLQSLKEEKSVVKEKLFVIIYHNAVEQAKLVSERGYVYWFEPPIKIGVISCSNNLPVIFFLLSLEVSISAPTAAEHTGA